MLMSYLHLYLETEPRDCGLEGWTSMYNILSLSLTYCLRLTTQIHELEMVLYRLNLLAEEIILIWIVLLQTSVLCSSWQELCVHHQQLIFFLQKPLCWYLEPSAKSPPICWISKSALCCECTLLYHRQRKNSSISYVLKCFGDVI